MKILKVIARLLDYPTQELLDNADSLKHAAAETTFLPAEQQQLIQELIEDWSNSDVYDLQEQYDGLFERGRYVSLMLFEHVHGESRDRGQAMVDLMEMYKDKGFELDSRQMPDYIPLFLEFLAEQDEPTAREWLADVSHILGLMEERLQQRDSKTSVLFSSLITISAVKIDRNMIKSIVDKEEQDDSMEAIDKEWEDKEVRFDDPISGQSCASGANSAKTNACSTAAGVTKLKTENHEIPVTWHEKFTDKAIQR